MSDEGRQARPTGAEEKPYVITLIRRATPLTRSLCRAGAGAPVRGWRRWTAPILGAVVPVVACVALLSISEPAAAQSGWGTTSVDVACGSGGTHNFSAPDSGGIATTSQCLDQFGSGELASTNHASGSWLIGGGGFATPPSSPTVDIGVRNCPGPFSVRCMVSNACGSVTSDTATLTITATVAADFNQDCLVDGSDYAIFAGCLGEPDAAPDLPCVAADLTVDNDVGLADFAAFQAAFTGG